MTVLKGDSDTNKDFSNLQLYLDNNRDIIEIKQANNQQEKITIF